MYFLITSFSAFSLENSDVCGPIRMGDGMGVSSGKIISDRGDASFGTVLPSFCTIKCEFLPLCGLFSSLWALIRSHSQSSDCFAVNDFTVFKI